MVQGNSLNSLSGYALPRVVPVGLVVVVLVLVTLGAWTPTASAAGGFADGGSGRFRSDIQWIQWGAKDTVLLNTGDGKSVRVTNTRSMGAVGTLEVTCTISGLTAITPEGGTTPIASGLKAYIPGDWAGDSLDNMYNIGGQGYWTTAGGVPGTFPSQYANSNTMAIGLRNVADHARMKFNYSCSALLKDTQTPNGRTIPLQGLVFADAEASSNRAGSGLAHQAEWIAATPTSGQNVSWYLLDRYRNQNCTTDMSVAVSTTNTMKMLPTGQECVYGGGGTYESPGYGSGPGGVMFMKGATSASVELQGRGYTAVALGVVVETDFGDAPASYGVAGSLFQPSWTTGTRLTAGSPTTTMWAMTMADNAGNRPSGVHLGLTEDPETTHLSSTDALGDDTSSTDDEDGLDNASIKQGGLLPFDVLNGTTATYTISGIACSGTGYVKGWIDWDGNGVFDADEGSTQTVPCSAQTTVTFTIPDPPVKTALVNKTHTYLRLRVFESDTDTGQGPTGVTLNGEVEDYQLTLPPQLSLVKSVVTSYGGTASPTDWSLTADGPTPPGSVVIVSGETRYVPAGTYTLSETALTHDAREGYAWDTLSCRSTPIGQSAWTGLVTTKASPSVSVSDGKKTECTFVNKDKPGSLVWAKVDPNGQPVGGSVWTLTGPGPGSASEVADCVQSPCSTAPSADQDPRPGFFRVINLVWGTYSMTEKTPPPGYQAVTGTFTFDTLSAAHLEATVSGTGVTAVEAVGGVVNTPLTGSVAWRKIDAQSSEPLSGSTWKLTGPELPADGLTVKDCTSAPCQATDVDTDPTPGAFLVPGLAWSADQYTLIESSAPVGYVLDSTPHTFVISIDKLNHTFATAFTNQKVSVPTLPLTGGLGADYFLIGGAALAVLAGGGALVRRRSAKSRD